MVPCPHSPTPPPLPRARLLQWVHRRYPTLPIYITENGVAVHEPTNDIAVSPPDPADRPSDPIPTSKAALHKEELRDPFVPPLFIIKTPRLLGCVPAHDCSVRGSFGLWNGHLLKYFENHFSRIVICLLPVCARSPEARHGAGAVPPRPPPRRPRRHHQGRRPPQGVCPSPMGMTVGRSPPPPAPPGGGGGGRLAPAPPGTDAIIPKERDENAVENSQGAHWLKGSYRRH